MDNRHVFLTLKDHSVSNETFQLIYNKEFEMLETHPQPSAEKLPVYYQSDDYISHTDSKRNLFEQVYHFVKSVALKRKLRLINSCTLEPKSLLDVGCGTGDFLQIAQNSGWNVLGIEPNEKARQSANKKTNNSVFNADEIFLLKENGFDVITLWHVLEHLPDLHAQIELYGKLLKQNGTLVIAVPNYNSFDAKFYKNHWAGYDVPRHLWHFSQSSISRLFSKEGMKVVNTLPMKFDAYYVSLLSERHKTGKMNPLKAFMSGWRSNLRALRSGEYSSLIYCIKKQ